MAVATLLASWAAVAHERGRSYPATGAYAALQELEDSLDQALLQRRHHEALLERRTPYLEAATVLRKVGMAAQHRVTGMLTHHELLRDKLTGLQMRVKSLEDKGTGESEDFVKCCGAPGEEEDSLTSKLEDRAKAEGATDLAAILKIGLEQMGDFVRYTLQASATAQEPETGKTFDAYSQMVIDAHDALTSSGFILVPRKFKNYWMPGNSYYGINAVYEIRVPISAIETDSYLISPEHMDPWQMEMPFALTAEEKAALEAAAGQLNNGDGTVPVRFEVQFNEEKAQSVKDKTMHGIYEVSRKMEGSLKEADQEFNEAKATLTGLMVKINEMNLQMPPDIKKVEMLFGEGGDAAPRPNKGAAPMTNQLRIFMNMWNPDNDGMTKAIELFIKSEGKLLQDESAALLQGTTSGRELNQLAEASRLYGMRAHEWTTQEDFKHILGTALATLQTWAKNPKGLPSIRGAAEALITLEENLWDEDTGGGRSLDNGVPVSDWKKKVDDVLLDLNRLPLVNEKEGKDWIAKLFECRVGMKGERGGGGEDANQETGSASNGESGQKPGGKKEAKLCSPRSGGTSG